MSTLSYFKTDNLKKLGVFRYVLHGQNNTILRPNFMHKQCGYDKAELYTVYMQSNLQKCEGEIFPLLNGYPTYSPPPPPLL
jgi:hypothetical protein